MAKPLFFYSDALLGYNMGESHPMKPQRLRMTYDLIASYGLFESDLTLTEPTHLSEEEAAETHSLAYLETMKRLSAGERLREATRYGFGSGDNPIFPGLYEASLLYSGGSAEAAQAILDGDSVAFNISGGLHHAHYDRAAGFCTLNDCAIAIRRLRRKFERVAYVDIDVHHGDGVQELFYEDPTVLTISLHESGRFLFPGTGFVEETGEGAGEGTSLNLPFAPYTTGETWLKTWRAVGLPVLRAFDPQAIVLQMGTDAHELDPLAHLCLTAQDWLEAVEDVRNLGKPIVAVGGGGYNLTTVTRMWTLATAALVGKTLPDAIPGTFPHPSKQKTLHDHHTPQVGDRDRDYATRFAEQVTKEVRELFQGKMRF